MWFWGRELRTTEHTFWQKVAAGHKPVRMPGRRAFQGEGGKCKGPEAEAQLA